MIKLSSTLDDLKRKQFFEMLQKVIPSVVAEELVKVQSINPQLGIDMMENCMTEEELLAAGYTPACKQTKLLWVKNKYLGL